MDRQSALVCKLGDYESQRFPRCWTIMLAGTKDPPERDRAYVKTQQQNSSASHSEPKGPSLTNPIFFWRCLYICRRTHARFRLAMSVSGALQLPSYLRCANRGRVRSFSCKQRGGKPCKPTNRKEPGDASLLVEQTRWLTMR